ncbi:MAG: hypothetical protein AUI33_09465 [Ignavibacteria bacterium 13_1_40CM_2_61_4]|nr:MAG: hypothetical protein AUI33_09465 [Ignavibacteria bacterium 13_1_40CM_2_61_4]
MRPSPAPKYHLSSRARKDARAAAEGLRFKRRDLPQQLGAIDQAVVHALPSSIARRHTSELWGDADALPG